MNEPKREMTVYSQDVKAEAIALAVQHGYRPAAAIIKDRYPELDTLSHNLIIYWHRVLDPEGFSALSQLTRDTFQSGLLNLGLKAMDKLDQELDREHDSAKHPLAGSIIAGIAIDKPLKVIDIEARRSRPAPSFNFANFIQTNVDSP